jgi:hypothetical protein
VTISIKQELALYDINFSSQCILHVLLVHCFLGRSHTTGLTVHSANRPEKLAKGSLCCLFLKLVQINFIFTDNVRILYMSVLTHRNKWSWLNCDTMRNVQSNLSYVTFQGNSEPGAHVKYTVKRN